MCVKAWSHEQPQSCRETAKDKGSSEGYGGSQGCSWNIVLKLLSVSTLTQV